MSGHSNFLKASTLSVSMLSDVVSDWGALGSGCTMFYAKLGKVGHYDVGKLSKQESVTVEIASK